MRPSRSMTPLDVLGALKMLFQDQGDPGQFQGLDIGEDRLPPLLILLQQHPFLRADRRP